jgi:hypothetical protein
MTQPGEYLFRIRALSSNIGVIAHSDWVVFNPHADVFSGRCGDNMTWSFNTITGVLEIEGSGMMWSFGDTDGTRPPWYIHRDGIRSVIINEGVTRIGNYAFADLENVTTISMPETMLEIGSYAFFNTNLTSVEIPENVTLIGNLAFANANLARRSLTNAVFLGAVPTTVGTDIFRNAHIDFVINYFAGKTGWTTPTWNGYRTAIQLRENQTVISVSSATARRGERVTVDINIINNPGFAGMALKVEVPAGFTLVSYELGNPALRMGTYIGPSIPSTGNINFVIGRTSNYTQNGLLIRLVFEVGENTAVGNYPINVMFETRDGTPSTPVNAALGELNMTIANGAVNVINYILGDVNGDGQVNSADLVLLARYLANHDGVTINTEAAMVTPQSIALQRIDVRDLVLLAQYLAGHDVMLGR